MNFLTLKKLFASLVAIVAVAGLSGCAVAPDSWSKGTGDFKIVASTNVWADIAASVGGEKVTSHALIFNINQDPHSYESSARDRLLFEDADLVIINGGGYDDFMLPLIEAAPDGIQVIDVYALTGSSGNEHLWYDLEAVELAARAIADAVQTDPTEFLAELAALRAEQDALAAEFAGTGVFMTEPLIELLLEDVKFANLTPEEFSEAIEEERDVSPTAFAESLEVLQSGEVAMVALNAATANSQVDDLLASQEASNIPVFGFSELLGQDPDTFEYDGGYIELMRGALQGLRAGAES